MPLRTLYTGTLPEDMREVLTMSRIGFTVSSNFARHYSVVIALAASNGWVSTVSSDGRAYSSFWSITSAGLIMLEHGLQ